MVKNIEIHVSNTMQAEEKFEGTLENFAAEKLNKTINEMQPPVKRIISIQEYTNTQTFEYTASIRRELTLSVWVEC